MLVCLCVCGLMLMLSVAYDVPPVFNVTIDYVWIFSPAFVEYKFAPVTVQSDRPLQLSVSVTGVQGTQLVLSGGFINIVNVTKFSQLVFPVQGTLKAVDNRAACITKTSSGTGPCQTIVAFTIHLHSKSFECPDQVFYVADEPTSISWVPPVVDRLSIVRGITQTVVPSQAPGTQFMFGITNITYNINWSGSPQLASTLISCQFPVWHNDMALSDHIQVYLSPGLQRVFNVIGRLFKSSSDSTAVILRDYLFDESRIYGECCVCMPSLMVV